MPTHRKAAINIDGQDYQVAPGATRGLALYALAKLDDTDQLFLEIPLEIDVPVAHHDLLFIRGGEQFSIGGKDSGIPDNPVRRTQLVFDLNGQSVELTHEQHSHAKAVGAQIRALVADNSVDLWVDLDGTPDVPIDDDDRIILQPNEVFFTVPRELSQDRHYQVTTIFDGNSHVVRFPALMSVANVIKRTLPSKLRVFAESYSLRDDTAGHALLNPEATLRDAGVRDGHVLSVLKTDPVLYFIFVNSKPRSAPGPEITYEDVVRLAEPNATFEFIYTVVYATPSGKDGTLAPAQRVQLEDGMDFRVRKTNRS